MRALTIRDQALLRQGQAQAQDTYRSFVSPNATLFLLNATATTSGAHIAPIFTGSLSVTLVGVKSLPVTSVAHVGSSISAYIDNVLVSTTNVAPTPVVIITSTEDVVDSKPDNVVTLQSLFENIVPALVPPTITEEFSFILQTIEYTVPSESVVPVQPTSSQVSDDLTWTLVTILESSPTEALTPTPDQPTVSETVTPTLTSV